MLRSTLAVHLKQLNSGIHDGILNHDDILHHRLVLDHSHQQAPHV